MSHEGNTYFFACHMLYTIMQMYYEFQEQRVLEMNQLREWYLKWMPTYEEITGWALEEIVFPFEYERLHTNKAREMGNFAEIRDEAIYKHLYDEILSFSYQLHKKHSNLNLNVLIYYHYCTLLTRVLKQFASIMNMENMISTEYFKHYQLESDTLKNFCVQLGDVEVLVKNAEKDRLTEIKLSTEQLAIEWNKAVFTAVQDFENLS